MFVWMQSIFNPDFLFCMVFKWHSIICIYNQVCVMWVDMTKLCAANDECSSDCVRVEFLSSNFFLPIYCDDVECIFVHFHLNGLFKYLLNKMINGKTLFGTSLWSLSSTNTWSKQLINPPWLTCLFLFSGIWVPKTVIQAAVFAHFWIWCIAVVHLFSSPEHWWLCAHTNFTACF